MTDSQDVETAPAGPLVGVRVVSLAVNLPGPVAAARLSALGAAVTKVEPPAGDLLATAAPAYYRTLSAGHQVVTLDLRTSAAHDALDALLSDADLLITSSRPASLDRLGLGWAMLHERHPQLSQVAIVGHEGAHADRPGHDLTYQADAGMLVGARMPPTLAADLAGGERAAQVACALLVSAMRRGFGGYAEVALASAAADLAAPLRHGLTTPSGVLGGAAPQYRLYAAADGHVAVAALEPHFWTALVAALSLPGDDDATRATHLAARLRERTASEWDAWARQNRLPLAAVRSPDGSIAS